MSLQLTYSIKFSGDCQNIILENTTGAVSASNVTGYGTPNPAVGDITSATVVITLPDGTVLSSLPLTHPTVPPDAPAITIFSATDLGLASIPEGIYKFTISESTIGSESAFQDTYTKVISTLNYCSTQCCLDKLIASLDLSDCECNEGNLKQVNKMNYYLLAAKDAASCNKANKANKLLKAAQDLCSQKKCNCNH